MNRPLFTVVDVKQNNGVDALVVAGPGTVMAPQGVPMGVVTTAHQSIFSSGTVISSRLRAQAPPFYPQQQPGSAHTTRPATYVSCPGPGRQHNAAGPATPLAHVPDTTRTHNADGNTTSIGTQHDNDGPAPAPHGGSVHNDLSDADINALCGTIKTKATVADALLFYNFRTGRASAQQMRQTLGDALDVSSTEWDQQRVLLAVHVRYHWLLGILMRGTTTRNVFLCVDSAPSPITRSDVRKIMRQLDTPVLFFHPFTQPKGSNQCGLFVFLNAMLAAADFEGYIEFLNTGRSLPVDLTSWRKYLTSIWPQVRTSDLPRLLRLADLPSDIMPHAKAVIETWTPQPAAPAPPRSRRNDPYAPNVIVTAGADGVPPPARHDRHIETADAARTPAPHADTIPPPRGHSDGPTAASIQEGNHTAPGPGPAPQRPATAGHTTTGDTRSPHFCFSAWAVPTRSDDGRRSSTQVARDRPAQAYPTTLRCPATSVITPANPPEPTPANPSEPPAARPQQRTPDPTRSSPRAQEHITTPTPAHRKRTADARTYIAGQGPGDAPADAAQAARAQRTLLQARALTQHEVRTKLRQLETGTMIRVVWRRGDHVDEWAGTLGSIAPERSTARAPTWKVTYFARPDGPLLADDDVSIVTEHGFLPTADGEEVLVIEQLDPRQQPAPAAPVDAPAPQPPDHADRDADEPTATRHIQQSSYARVPDGPPAAMDASVWERMPPPISPQQYHEAPITGAEFLGYEILNAAQAQARATDLVWAAATESVRHMALAEIRAIQEHVRQQGAAARDAPLDAVLVHYYQHAHHQKKWRYSTLSRHLGACVGALVNLSLYTKNGRGLNPTVWARFKAAMQTARRLSTAQGIREPKLATPETIRRAVDAAEDKGTAALTIALHMTAQRLGDLIHSKKEHWRFGPNCEITVKLMTGKTVASQGCHHIHTALKDERLFAILRDYILATKHAYIWPIATAYQRAQMTAKVRRALRAADPDLEVRSMRRSTLCIMAAAGASEQELLIWSRHKSIEMLRRYLYYELIPSRDHASMQRLAAEALFPAGQATPVRGAGPETRSFDGLVTCTADGDTEFAPRAPKPADARRGACDALPVHIGKQPGIEVPIDTAGVDAFARELPPHHPDRIAWLEDRENLRDANGRHAAMAWDGVLEVADLTRDDIDVLQRARLIRRVLPAERHRVRGTIRVFPKEERDKNRKRVIFWTRLFNDTYPAEAIAPNRGNSTRSIARQAILHAEGACHADYCAYFSSIPIEDDVSWHECFITEWGEVYRNVRCATGKRPHTSLATSMTRIIAHDGARPASVTFETATDGMRFAGPKDACIDAMWHAVQRSKAVNARMNDIDVHTATRETVAALWQTRDADWIGDVVDFRAKTIRCRDKHVQRLESFAAQVRSPGATHADVFRLWAMILYMADTLAMPLHEHRQMREYIRRAAQLLFAYPHLWERRCFERPPAELNRAVDICRRNAPTRVTPAPTIDAVLITDASAVGWAAILVHRDRAGLATLEHIQRQWDPNTLAAYDMGQSTKAEPEALARAAEWARLRRPRAALVAATDHHGMVDAYARGYAPSPMYDTRVARLAKTRVDTVVFTPGETNPSDRLSRFLTTEPSAEEQAAAIAIADAYLGRQMGRNYRLQPA